MAKKRICIDAGHYGKYNQSPVNKKYYESEMSWKLQNYLKPALEKYGFEVILTRSNQKVDRELYDRGAASKGCVLFLSLHSNATGSSSPDYAVACCQVDDKSSKIDDVSVAIGKRLADCVNKTMGSKGNWQILRRMGNYNKDYYGVLRGAKDVGTPAVLMEHGFHTNLANTNWLLKNANLKKLAEAEAKEIAAYFGMDTKPVLDKTGSKLKSKNTQSFAVKRLLQIAYLLKIVSTCPTNDGLFGNTTKKAVNELLKKWGYKENGIAGTQFVNKLSNEIKNKIR